MVSYLAKLAALVAAFPVVYVQIPFQLSLFWEPNSRDVVYG